MSHIFFYSGPFNYIIKMEIHCYVTSTEPNEILAIYAIKNVCTIVSQKFILYY